MGRINRILVVCLAVLLVVLLLANACAKPAPPSPEWKTIKWGAAVELSGAAAGWGILQNNSNKLAVKHINDAGGIVIGGERYKVELITEDCKSTPEGTIAAYEKLITMDKVSAIISPMCSAFITAGVPTIEKYGIVCLVSGTINDELAPMSRWQFVGTYGPKTMANAYMQVLLQYVEPEPERVAIVVSNSKGAIGYLRLAEEKAKAAGKEIVAFEIVPMDETDFMSIATSVKAADPDIIFHNQQGMQSGLFLKQLGELGIVASEMPMVGLGGFASTECKKIAGPYYEGLWICGEMVPRSEVPHSMTFIEDYHKMYGYDPGALEMACYDSIWSLAYAFEKVTKIGQSAEAQEQLRQALLSVKFEGIMGSFSYNEDGAALLSMSITHVEQGEKVSKGWSPALR